jgi:DNA-binding response OmpR family regulator
VDAGLDGPGFYRKLKQQRAEAAPPFLFVTGDHEKPDYASFLEEEAVAFLVKPFSEAALTEAVERMLRRWGRKIARLAARGWPSWGARHQAPDDPGPCAPYYWASSSA